MMTMMKVLLAAPRAIVGKIKVTYFLFYGITDEEEEVRIPVSASKRADQRIAGK